jgi:putative peptidoglycan lipid II flippase
MPQAPRNSKTTDAVGALIPPPGDGPVTEPVVAAQPVEHQVVGALGSIGAATLASRVLGFARDMIVALVFGAGPVTDAFFVAFRIPNILRRLLAEGALSTAVIPVFTGFTVRESRGELLRMLRAVFGAALLALSVTTALGMAGAPWIVRAIAPGFAADPGQAQLAAFLTRVMFPYLVLVGLAALAMGALNAQGRFFAAALGPAVMNLGMIVCVLALAPRVHPGITSLAIGVLAGGLGQLLVQLPSLHACGLLVGPSAELRHPALARVTRLLLPSVFGLAALQVMVFVNTLLASLLPAGSISFLYYADRVMEFPLGVFGIALASASLPAMSRQAAAGDTRGVASTLNFALRLSVYVSLPASVGLVALSRPITRILFERGRFGPEDTAATATALIAYAVGLLGFAGARIAAQAFYALAEPATAVRVGIVSIAANALAAIVLMRPMGHVGLALASSIGSYVNLVVLVWTARRRLGRVGARRLLDSTLRITVACVPLLAWCVAASVFTEPRRGAPLWLGGAWLGGVILVGGLLFVGATVVIGSPEREALMRMLPWRRSR